MGIGMTAAEVMCGASGREHHIHKPISSNHPSTTYSRAANPQLGRMSLPAPIRWTNPFANRSQRDSPAKREIELERAPATRTGLSVSPLIESRERDELALTSSSLQRRASNDAPCQCLYALTS